MDVNISRREFLSAAAAVGAAATLGGADGVLEARPDSSRDVRASAPADRKLLVVLFGGGTRSSETIDDPTHRHVPRLWDEIVPKGALFTNMRVERKVVHPNSAGSIVTGHWEWDDVDWSRPVAHPTIFEIHRKARHAPDVAAWAFVYASILAKAGESLAPGYGARYAANVVEPPKIPRTSAERIDRLMQHAASLGSPEAETEAARECESLARSTSRIATGGLRSDETRSFLREQYGAWKTGAGTTSHDAFLTDGAIACTRQFAPAVMVVAFGEIDCAHYGSWPRYVEAIRRTDELTWRLWRATEEIEAYRGRTLLLILPDHGRELDRPGRWGFIHHSDFYTNQGADEGCRRVWMAAVGPGIKAGRRVDGPVPITAAAATGLEHLGLQASTGAEGSVWRLVS